MRQPKYIAKFLAKLLLIAAGTTALAACNTGEESRSIDTDPAVATTMDADAPVQRRATTTLTTAAGEEVGSVTATEIDEQVVVRLKATGLEPGEHGVHVHQTGLCDAPDFKSAGGHWNPTDQAHGLDDPQGQHAGDMPNLTVGQDGTGTLEYTLEGGAGFDGLMDTDGSAFIVHAGRDDQITDPSGDSGSRVACGVFVLRDDPR